jgi:hypothetical protein
MYILDRVTQHVVRSEEAGEPGAGLSLSAVFSPEHVSQAQSKKIK